MRLALFLPWFCLALLCPAFAGEPIKTDPPAKPKLPDGTPAEQVRALVKQYDDARAAFLKRYEAAESDAAQMLLLPFFPDPNAYAKLFVQVAEKHPNDPAALDALLWVVKHTRAVPNKTDTPFARAKPVLVRDYLRHPKIGTLCLALRYEEMNPQAVQVVRQVLEKNPDQSAQAQAAFALATLLRRRAESAEYFNKKADPKMLASFEKIYGKEAVADVRRADPDALKKESEALLERLTKEKTYAATVIDYGEKKVALGELADRELFEIRHLQPGRPAPDIVGEDIDGRPLKLSDYRGKVVLLDFWGHWLGPCRAMYPHERSLVEKYQDKPFVIVGVNSDSKRDQLQKIVAREKLTWRSFWDGGSTQGPIASRWNVTGWPTVYLIDHEGVIVRRIGRSKEDDALIEQKVNEAAAAMQKGADGEGGIPRREIRGQPRPASQPPGLYSSRRNE